MNFILSRRVLCRASSTLFYGYIFVLVALGGLRIQLPKLESTNLSFSRRQTFGPTLKDIECYSTEYSELPKIEILWYNSCLATSSQKEKEGLQVTTSLDLKEKRACVCV